MRTTIVITLFLYALSASAQSHWTAIMSQGTKAQSYNSFYLFSDVEEFIREQAKKGKVVSELEYANSKWYVVATGRDGEVNITWKSEKEFPKSWVSEQWGKGKDIIKVAWGSDKWVVIMTDKTNYSLQRWAIRDTWEDLEKWMAESRRENTAYNISEVTYGNGKWLCVMSIMNNYEAQSYTISKDFPTKWIQSKYDSKYNITAVEHNGENWYVVMNKKSTQLGEIILNPQSAFPEDKIKEQWDKERRITGLVYTGKSSSDADLDWDADLFAALLELDSFDDLVKAGRQKVAAKNYTGAITDYEAAVKINSDNHEVWNSLAWAKFNAGYCYTSLSDVDKSIALKSTPYNQHTKGAILKCQDKCAEALPYFNEAIRLYRAEFGKVNQVSYYLDRAEAKQCLKNYAGALDDIDLALAIEPSNSALLSRQKELNRLLAGK